MIKIPNIFQEVNEFLASNHDATFMLIHLLQNGVLESADWIPLPPSYYIEMYVSSMYNCNSIRIIYILSQSISGLDSRTQGRSSGLEVAEQNNRAWVRRVKRGAML